MAVNKPDKNTFQVHIRGDEALMAKLNEMIDQMPEMGEQAMTDSLLLLHSRVPSYPPQRSTTSYRRTGTLGRSVTALASSNPDSLSEAKAMEGNVQGTFGTRLKYARWVIDKERQVSWAQGYWYTLQDVVEDNQSGINRIWENMIKELVNL